MVAGSTAAMPCSLLRRDGTSLAAREFSSSEPSVRVRPNNETPGRTGSGGARQTTGPQEWLCLTVGKSLRSGVPSWRERRGGYELLDLLEPDAPDSPEYQKRDPGSRVNLVP
jgi:hypothetical protein